MIDFSSAEWDKKFRSILADIDQHKCIVLIGPEIVKIGQYPFKEVLRNHLQIPSVPIWPQNLIAITPG